MAGEHGLSGPRAHAALACVALVWAGAFAAIKHLLDAGLTAPEVAAARYLTAAPGFVVALRMSGGLSGATRRELARVAVAGLLVVAAYHVALNAGERYTTSGTAAVIIGTAPGMTLGLAIALGMERFSPWRLAGLIVAFAGVLVVVLLGSGQHVSFADARGPLIVLIAPLAFALYNVMAKPLIARHSAIAVTAAASLAGSVALLPGLGPSSLDTARRLDAWDWTLVLYLGIVCTLVAYIAWTRALHSLEASQAAAYLYAIPPIAVVVGAVTLGEQVTVWLVAGAVLVIGGVAIAQVQA
ncbi:MAG: DMT family transporter [Gaiellales bacterium]